ncbi:hypothetical protein, partial [Alteromonas stellipolaris]|uniref:hypothetical protein n=1 Tax=Alteromonas stellipolaris TaxID=233316 RepID=UPI001DAD9274
DTAPRSLRNCVNELWSRDLLNENVPIFRPTFDNMLNSTFWSQPHNLIADDTQAYRRYSLSGLQRI